MSHINIPIFVPHLGCPHTCVFCNQHTITGQCETTLDEIDNAVSQTIALLKNPTAHELQIAFFGGSFTAIERNKMLALLEKANYYVKKGSVKSIRLSTRPDCIDDEILAILSEHSVKAIELGIQSTDKTVLEASERGHTAKNAETACRKIKEYGFELVGQMMLGLPASTPQNELQTARDMISWGIDKARIYPTVVFADTSLARFTEEKRYTPLSVEEAVDRAAQVYSLFTEHNVEVIRIGLCENEGLRSDKTVGGAHHPALGELVLNRYYLNKILNTLQTISPQPNTEIVIESHPSVLSQTIGQKKCNFYALAKAYPHNTIRFLPSHSLCGKEVKIFVKEI